MPLRGLGYIGAGGADPTGVPPWNAPPADARVVDYTTELVSVLATSTVEVLSYQVPTDLRLVVVRVGFDALDPTDLVRATWTAKAGGEVLTGYHYLPAAIGYVDDPSEAFMHIDRGLTLSFEVTNNFPVLDCWYRARIFGWVYKPDRKDV